MIAFTQYLRPDGEAKEITIERPAEIEAKAAKLKNLGATLEIEVLATGEVSMTVELKDETLAIEVVPNGPEVPSAVDRMITKALAEVLALPSR